MDLSFGSCSGRARPVRVALTLSAAALSLASARVPLAAELTLEEALARAAEANAEVLRADAGVDAAAPLQAGARALWRPSVDVTASYTYFYDEATLDLPNPYAPLAPYLRAAAAADPGLPDPSALTGAPGTSDVIRHQHDVRAGVTVTQPVYLAAARPVRALADAADAEARAGLSTVQDRVRGAVIDTYFGALGAQRLVEVREQLVELARLDLGRARAGLEAGVGEAFGVTRAEVSLLSAERDLAAARIELELATDALGELTGSAGPIAVVAPQTPAVGALEPGWAESRPDVRLGEAAADRLDADAARARSGLVPVVLARANASAQREAAFGGDALQWNVQLVAAWSAWDGGARAAEARRADALAEQSRRAAEAARIAAEGEARRTQIRIGQLERDVAQARQEQELATTNAEVTWRAYGAGVASWTDVEAARRQQALAQIAVADSEVQLMRARYQLGRLAGGLP